MVRYLVAYVITAVVFFGLDAVYLRFAGGPMYRNALGDYLIEPMRVAPALAFYLIFIAGLIFFAVAPALAAASLQTALIRGAAIGFLGYSAYELTNYATLARWTPTLVAVDMTWGTVLSGAASTAAYVLVHRWFSAA